MEFVYELGTVVDMLTSIRTQDFSVSSVSAPMTVNGTLVKTVMLLLVSAVAGTAGWAFLPNELLLPAMLVSIGGAIGFSIWARKQPLNAKWPAVLYALMQGALVGAVAREYSQYQDGIVLTALAATAATVLTSLALYAAGIVRVNQKARSIIFMLTLGAFVFYGAAIVLALFGVAMPGLSGGGVLGYGISILMLALATANLFSIYSIVDEAVKNHAEEGFEWFAAFGIASVVLWIFVEFLRLFARSR